MRPASTRAWSAFMLCCACSAWRRASTVLNGTTAGTGSAASRSVNAANGGASVRRLEAGAPLRSLDARAGKLSSSREPETGEPLGPPDDEDGRSDEVGAPASLLCVSFSLGACGAHVAVGAGGRPALCAALVLAACAVSAGVSLVSVS